MWSFFIQNYCSFLFFFFETYNKTTTAISATTPIYITPSSPVLGFDVLFESGFLLPGLFGFSFPGLPGSSSLGVSFPGVSGFFGSSSLGVSSPGISGSFGSSSLGVSSPGVSGSFGSSSPGVYGVSGFSGSIGGISQTFLVPISIIISCFSVIVLVSLDTSSLFTTLTVVSVLPTIPS